MTSRRALAWSLTERYASLAVGLASSMVLARLLTPAEIGLFSLCAAVMLMSSVVRDFGVTEFIVQEKELTQSKMRSVFGVAIVFGWGIGLIIYLSRDLFASLYGEPRIAALLAVLSINFLLLPFASPAFAMLNREMEFKRVLGIQLGSTLTGAATSLTLALNGQGPFSLAWASVASGVMQCLLVTWMRPKSSLLLPGFSEAWRVVRYGAFTMASRIIDTAASSAHEFIIARQFGFADLGMFSRAKGLTDMFNANVTSAVARVATPTMASAHRDDVSLVHTFAKGTAVFTSIAWPFFGFLALCAPEIIGLMFGHQWDHAGQLARLLAMSMMPSALYALSHVVMAATGQVKKRLLVSLQYGPIHVVGLLFTSLVSLEAMALWWFCTNAIIALSYSLQIRSILKASWSALYGASLRSVPIAVATIATQFAALETARMAGLHEAVLVTATALAGVIAWILTARAFGHPSYDELLRLWRANRPVRTA